MKQTNKHTNKQQQNNIEKQTLKHRKPIVIFSDTNYENMPLHFDLSSPFLSHHIVSCTVLWYQSWKVLWFTFFSVLLSVMSVEHN